VQFNFPASDNEKEIVHKAMSDLRESLARSADFAETLISLLDENFLAIDAEYKKQLTREYQKIGAAMWETNIALHKMMQHKQRIISPEQSEL
jgi:ABC-type Fe3+/spermidine/putrescine transport system ATPase subunit